MTELEEQAFRKGFLAGFGFSSEGWNGEYCNGSDAEKEASIQQALEEALKKARSE